MASTAIHCVSNSGEIADYLGVPGPVAVRGTVLCASETWTLLAADTRTVEAFLTISSFLTQSFLPARRYASAGLCDSDVSVCPSVRLSVCLSVRLSHAGIVPSRAKAGS